MVWMLLSAVGTSAIGLFDILLANNFGILLIGIPQVSQADFKTCGKW